MILRSYLLIFALIAIVLCFSSSITVFSSFLLTLYFASRSFSSSFSLSFQHDDILSQSYDIPLNSTCPPSFIFFLIRDFFKPNCSATQILAALIKLFAYISLLNLIISILFLVVSDLNFLIHDFKLSLIL